METLIAKITEMTLGQLAGYAALLFGGLSTFVEFSKIKINPLSTALRWMGDRLNGPVIDRLNEQDKAIASMSEVIDENEIDRIRWEILAFANSCRQGKRHSKDEFDHIIDLNTKYHTILDRRQKTNGILDLEYDYIIKIYRDRQVKNDFL